MKGWCQLNSFAIPNVSRSIDSELPSHGSSAGYPSHLEDHHTTHHNITQWSHQLVD